MASGQRRRVPSRPGMARSTASPGTGQVAGQVHDVLAVLVGQRLAHRRLGAGLECRPPPPTRSAAAAAGGSRPPTHTRARRWRSSGSAVPPAGRTRSTRSSAVGPIPHSAPAPDSETRSLPRVTLASDQPWPRCPTRFSAGRRTSSRKTSLKVWAPVMSTRGRTVTPGASIGQMKYEIPWCSGRLGLGAGQQDPEPGHVGVARSRPSGRWTTHSSPSSSARVVSDARSEPGAGLAEQLAPDLLAGQQRQQVALLLLGGAGVEDGGTGPADADGVLGTPDPGPAELVVDDQLERRVGAEPPGRGPVRGDQPRSASSRPDGSGCGSSQLRTASRRGSSSAGSAKSTAASVGCTGPSGPACRYVPEACAVGRPTPRQGDEEPIVSTWNFADVWEAVADALPDAPALDPRRPTPAPGPSSTSGPTAWPDGSSAPASATRTRWPSTSTTARSTSRPPSPASSSDWSRSTPTTATPTTSWSTCGRTPMPSRWSSTASSSERIEGIRGRVPRCPQLAVGRRRDRDLPVVGGPLRGGRRDDRYRRGAPAFRAGARSLGPRARRPLHALHRRDHGHAQGVMWRQDDLFARLNGGGFRRYPEDGGPRTSAAELGRSGPGMTLLPACPLMHGTGGFTAIECLSEGGRVVTLASRQLRPGRAARHRRARAGQRPGHRGRRLRQAHPRRPRRPPRPLGPVQPGRHRLLGGHVERGDQAGPARATTRACCSSTPSPRRRPSGMGTSVSSAQRRGPHRALHPRARGAGASTPTAGTSSPARARPGCWPSAVGSPSATTRTRPSRRPPSGPSTAVRYSVPGDYAEVGADGTIHLLGRGSVVHQHRRREGLPRRGGGGGQDRRTASSTPWWSASRTSASAKRSWPWSSSPRDAIPDRSTPSAIIEHVKARPGRVQGAAAGPLRRRPSDAPRRARSTTPATAAETRRVARGRRSG